MGGWRVMVGWGAEVKGHLTELIPRCRHRVYVNVEFTTFHKESKIRKRVKQVKKKRILFQNQRLGATKGLDTSAALFSGP